MRGGHRYDNALGSDLTQTTESEDLMKPKSLFLDFYLTRVLTCIENANNIFVNFDNFTPVGVLSFACDPRTSEKADFSVALLV